MGEMKTMKVKELIEKLKQFDEDADVYVSGDDRSFEINHVEQDNVGDVAIG